MRRFIIAAVTFVSGLYYVLNFILPKKIGEFEFGLYDEQIGTGIQVVGVMAIGLGIANIVRMHGGKVIRAGQGALYSVALLLGLFLMFFVEGFDFINSERSYQAWKPFSDLLVYVESIKGEVANADSAIKVAAEITQLCPEIVAEICALSFSGVPESVAPYFKQDRKIDLAKGELLRLVQSVREGKGFFTQDLSSPSRALVARDFFEAAAKAQDGFAEMRSAAGADVMASTGEVSGAHAYLDQQLSALTSSLMVIKGKAKAFAEDVYSQHIIKKGARLLYGGFFEPLSTAMFALLGFYIANAAYRSFRLRSVEAAVMMFAAVIIILGQTPIGPMVIPSLPVIRVWVLETLNTAGGRAMYFGTAIAALALAVRMWLSLDKSPFADGSN